MSNLAVLMECEGSEMTLYKRLLQDKGYAVIVATSIEQYYEILDEQAIDLLIVNANEYMHHIQANEFQSVIAMTPSIAMTNNTFSIKSQNHQFSAILQQPVAFSSFTNTVQLVSHAAVQ